jgi:hypothetical protein
MATEFLTDKNPQYIHNPHTTYENTVLQEHSAIVSGLRDTNTDKSMVEVQGRLLIGMCKKEETEDFINRRYNAYFKYELEKTSDGISTPDRKAIAINRTWLRLITEAMSSWIPKYKVDGCKAKIAVIDDILPDGRRIIDIDDRLSIIRDLLPPGYELVKTEEKINPDICDSIPDVAPVDVLGPRENPYPDSKDDDDIIVDCSGDE